MSLQELKNQISTLGETEKFELICSTVGELSARSIKGLVSSFETAFDVKARQAIAFDLPTEINKPDKVEPEAFDVVLKSIGDRRLSVIKTVRQVTGHQLRDSKNLVDRAPVTIKDQLPLEEAESLRAMLEESGAVVELKAANE
jgi:large subunit ribosomal protein L7/L12